MCYDDLTLMMAVNHHIDRKAPWRRALPVVGLLLITVAFFWKLTLTDQYIWFDHPDMAYLEIPRLQFQAKELRAGHFPLWDPHLWSGQPLIGQTQPGPVFPLNLIFYKVALKAGYLQYSALNWYWALLHFLAAAMAYALARDLGLSQSAGLVGGVAFGLGGFVGTVAWLDVVNGIIWAPAIFLFLLRAGRTERVYGNAAAAGVFLGLAWLSGHHEMPILLSVTAMGTWCWLCRRNSKLILPAILFLFIAVLVSGVQTLPTYEFGRISRRWVGLGDSLGWKDRISYKVHTLYSMPPKGFLAMLFPGLGRYADATLYFGWLVTAFAFLGVAMRWKEPVVRWALALAGIFAVYSVGVFAPLNGVIYAIVPILDKARIPARGIAIFGFAACVLAMYGFEAMLTERESIWGRRMTLFLGSAGALVLAIVLAFSFADKPLDERIATGGLACLGGCALLAAWRNGAIRQTTMVTGILVIVLVELTGGGPYLQANRMDQGAWAFADRLSAHRDIAEFLRKDQADGPFRVAVNDEEVGINFGDQHGIDALQGYVAGVPANLLRHELHTPRTQDLFNVRYTLSTKSDRPGQQQEVFTGVSGVKVFRNPNAFPRTWLVHAVKEVANDGYLRMAVQDPALDLRQTAIFIGKAPVVAPCGAIDRVAVLSRGTDRMIVDVETQCAGLLVVSETNYPGWSVKVDGKRERVWEVYGALRGVEIPAGRHQVEWKFRPWSVYVGLGMTLVGLTLAGAAIIGRK